MIKDNRNFLSFKSYEIIHPKYFKNENCIKNHNFDFFRLGLNSDPLKSTPTSEMLKQFYEMESNIVWKNHLQFFKYFVCQEMKILIIL